MILGIKGTKSLNSRVYSFDTFVLLTKLFDLYGTKLKSAATVAAIAVPYGHRGPPGHIPVSRRVNPAPPPVLGLPALAYRRHAAHIIRFIERLLNEETEYS